MSDKISIYYDASFIGTVLKINFPDKTSVSRGDDEFFNFAVVANSEH